VNAEHGGADAGTEASAAELLAEIFRSQIAAIRAALPRVIASGRPRRPAGARGRGSPAEASEQEKDTEAVHDFRVALRRVRTLLRPARGVFGKKRLLPIADGLRAYARATSALRDEEVLQETLRDLPLEEGLRVKVDGWLGRRARVERAHRAEVIRMLADGAPVLPAASGEGAGGEGAPPALEACLEQLERRLDRPKKKKRRAEKLGRIAIAEALAGARALAVADPADGAAMHALRIRFKRLRYAAEAFSPALGERAERAAVSAARMQKRLGSLHDVDEALLRVRRARGLGAAERGAVVEALLIERARLVGKASADLAREMEALSAAWEGEGPGKGQGAPGGGA
jgi:CHAD domain-containing protein